MSNSTADAAGEQDSAAALVSAVSVNFGTLCGIVVVFTLLRLKFPDVYAPHASRRQKDGCVVRATPRPAALLSRVW
jgi:hypothetical protein